MSSIMRRRSGLISVIGGLPFQGWGEAPEPWQTEQLELSATAPGFSRVSGLVQSGYGYDCKQALGRAAERAKKGRIDPKTGEEKEPRASTTDPDAQVMRTMAIVSQSVV